MAAVDFTTPVKHSEKSPWWMALVFAGGILLAGMLDAWLSLTVLDGGAIMQPDLKYPPIYPPAWLFWAVWLVIYPCWGVATWLVWRRRYEVDLRGFWLFFAFTLLVNMAFMPINALTRGNPLVLSAMDATGLILRPLSLWLYWRYAKATFWWLLPSTVWLPITLSLKVWLWLLNI